jgi:hypothetical protein
MTTDQTRLPQKLLFPFLQADGIHDRLALDAFQSRLQYVPAGRVDHQRHPRNIRFAGDEVEEFPHRRRGVQHPLVHVDVNDLRPVFHLLARNLQGRVEVVRLDELAEPRRACDVGPFADVDEQPVRVDVQRLESCQPATGRLLGQRPGGQTPYRISHPRDVFRSRPATAPHHVDKALLRKLPD